MTTKWTPKDIDKLTDEEIQRELEREETILKLNGEISSMVGMEVTEDETY